MNVNKIKHLILIKLIIFLGKIIEINFLRNIFKIIIDKKKFTTVADIFLDKFIRLGIFLLYPGKGVLSEESRNILITNLTTIEEEKWRKRLREEEEEGEGRLREMETTTTLKLKRGKFRLLLPFSVFCFSIVFLLYLY